jgi:hypothetical protein
MSNNIKTEGCFDYFRTRPDFLDEPKKSGPVPIQNAIV